MTGRGDHGACQVESRSSAAAYRDRLPRLNLRVAAHAAASRSRGRAGDWTGISLLSRSWHEQTIYRASGVMLFLCCHAETGIHESAEHSMRMSRSVGYVGPAHGQARKL